MGVFSSIGLCTPGVICCEHCHETTELLLAAHGADPVQEAGVGANQAGQVYQVPL